MNNKILVYESENLLDTLIIGLNVIQKPEFENLEKAEEIDDDFEEITTTKSINDISNNNNDFFEHLRKYQSEIGQRGELFVIDIEKEKLKNTRFVNRIEHVSKKDDAAGYDIISFETDGTQLYIEVKTTDKNCDIFYITENELARSKALKEEGKKYLIYRVTDILSEPKCSIIEDISKAFILEPLVWRVKEKILEKHTEGS